MNSALRTWDVDRVALADACAMIGLTKEVRVRLHGRVGATRGNWRWSGHHNIMLKSYAQIEDANHTLWHELAHARQFERAGCNWKRMHAESAGANYEHDPLEIEAREVADEFSNIPLLRERVL